MNFLSKNLTYLRGVFDVTQTGLALQLKKSQSTVGGWENEVSEPNVSALINISEFFGISIDHLLTSDLEKGNLISKEHIAEFKKKGNLIGKPIGNLKPIYKGLVPEEQRQLSVANEADAASNWGVVKILQSMDQKLDRLLIIGEKGAKK